MEHFHQVTEDLKAPYRELVEAIPDVLAGYGAMHRAAMAEGALSIAHEGAHRVGHRHHPRVRRVHLGPCAWRGASWGDTG